MDFNDFVLKPQHEIEPQLSLMGYMFTKEIDLPGDSFICNYKNPEEKKMLQLVYQLYSHTAFCHQVYETDMED